MSFPPQFLDEIRARVPVSAVVGRRVPLKRQGREFIGLSPFKNEKTPSFTVNDEKGFYHCFSSGEHGDIFTFLMKTENLSFPEAVERLAGEAGLALPTSSPQEKEKYRRQLSLLECTEAAAKWFAAQLATQPGAGARDYLRRRGDSDATAEAFVLGLAPARRTTLKEAMLARGFPEDKLIEAGLLIKPADGGETFDRFRNRLMFPIRDRRGRTVAFGGRALDDAPAKYLNSPETPLFHKGRLLFNVDRARAKAAETGRVIVVEGYMDVIGLTQAGFGEVVAPLGTALTETHFEELWRLAETVILFFDGDEAGRRAAVRAIDRLLPLARADRFVRFAFLPEGEDPDSLAHSQGPKAVESVLAQARPTSEILWLGLVNAFPEMTAEHQAAIQGEIDRIVRKIKDLRVRGAVRRDLSDRLWRRFRRENRKVSGSGNLSQTLVALTSTAAHGIREVVILMTVINHPGLLDLHSELFSALSFRSPDLDKLRSAIIPIFADDPGLDSERLRSHLLQQGWADLLQRLEIKTGGRRDTEWFMREDAALQDVEKAWLHLAHRQKKLQEQEGLEQQLQSIGQDMSSEEEAALLAHVKEYLGRREGEEATVEGYGKASGFKTTSE